jgi:hypothetical protein
MGPEMSCVPTAAAFAFGLAADFGFAAVFDFFVAFLVVFVAMFLQFAQ